MVIPLSFSLDKREGVFSPNEFRYFSLQLQEVTRSGVATVESFDPRRAELAVLDTVVGKGYDDKLYSGALESLTDQVFYDYRECAYRVMTEDHLPPAASLSFSTQNPARLRFFAVTDELRRDSLLTQVSNYVEFDTHCSYNLGAASSPTSLLHFD